MSVTVRAAAKINLALGVGAARADGYHSLDTVYQAIGLYDDVRVEAAAEWSVAVTPVGGVAVSEVPLDDTNLAVRAGMLLTDYHGVDRSAALHIDKGIPVAGGLAGGSADAAAALVALDRLWALRTSDEDLLALAAQLGSDVPFALLGGVAHGTGRGEQVVPLPAAGEFWWVVVPATEGLATPAVYAELDRLRPEAPEPATTAALLEALDDGDVEAVGALLANDLEPAALSLRHDLAKRRDLLAQLHPGPVLLSGSGPTLLGLASTHGEATATRALLADEALVAHVAPGPVAGAHVLEVTR